MCVGVIHDSSGHVGCGDMSTDSRSALGEGHEAVDYEVPEKIKTLHHLALQYVNQVYVLD